MFSFFYSESSGIQQLSQDICSQRPRLCLHPMAEFHSQLRSEGLCSDWPLGPEPRTWRLSSENFPKHYLLCLGFHQHLLLINDTEDFFSSAIWSRLTSTWTTRTVCMFKCVYIQLGWRAIFMTLPSSTLLYCGQKRGQTLLISTCDSLSQCMKVQPKSSSLRM